MNLIYNALLSGLFLITSASTFAGEVDNYYAWGKPIKDSAAAFNDHLNQQIEKSLVAINENGDFQQCQQVSLQIMKNLGAQRYPLTYRGALNAEMEYWAQETPAVDRIPGDDISLNEYAQNSLYAPAMRTAGIKTDLDHIVNNEVRYLRALKDRGSPLLD
ncbi:hypothetical protein AB4376_18740 [Vibrio breoganii]